MKTDTMLLIGSLVVGAYFLNSVTKKVSNDGNGIVEVAVQKATEEITETTIKTAWSIPKGIFMGGYNLGDEAGQWTYNTLLKPIRNLGNDERWFS